MPCIIYKSKENILNLNETLFFNNFLKSVNEVLNEFSIWTMLVRFQGVINTFFAQSYRPPLNYHCTKIEALHQGFLQKIWPNPQFHGDFVTSTVVLEL